MKEGIKIRGYLKDELWNTGIIADEKGGSRVCVKKGNVFFIFF